MGWPFHTAEPSSSKALAARSVKAACMFVFRNVQLTEWLVVFVAFQSSIVVKYSFCRVLFGKGGLIVVFSFGSSPTVESENRAKRLQPYVNNPHFHFWFWSGFRFNGIYKMANKTRQKLFYNDTWFGTSTNTTNHLVSCTFLKTFKVVLRTGLWMPVAIHSEAGRGDSRWAKYPRQNQ